jgi:hypothetical protein
MTRRLDDWTVARIAVGLASFLPFLGGVASGACFYFRDLSSYFFPLRRFVVEGLRHGEIRHWNPYVNEGTPVLLPPLGYPLDALQALLPNEWGFSLLLALHVPLAALTFLALARRLGCRPEAAALGALVYALSGFALSSLNLYIHVEALAWAPLVTSTLIGAASGGAREIALAGIATGLCLSTTGVEIAAQAVACAFLLSASRRLGGLLRFAAGVLLGAGIAASPLVALLTQLSGSQRDAGFKVAESLSHSVHPAQMLQVLVAHLFGNPIAAGDEYWGGRFSGGQYPYFVSLYLGGGALAFALVGAFGKDRYRKPLGILLALALVVSLGRWARLDVLLGLVPLLAKFRFPVKAFFSVVTSIALLASLGAERLLASRRPWRTLLLLAALVACGLLAFALVASGVLGAWQPPLFVDSYPQALRSQALAAVAADAAQGAAVLLAVAALAWLALRERVAFRFALVASTALVAADLVRAGSGLNPTAPSPLYTLSPEMTTVADRLRQAGGRVFTCLAYATPTFQEAIRSVHNQALWSTVVYRETLSPYANVPERIDTTGADATALVAGRLSMTSSDLVCRDPATLDRLRAAGARYILSVQRFTNEALRLVDVAAPARTAPLAIQVYELSGSLPDPNVWESPDDLDALAHARSLEGAAARYVETRPGHVSIAVETKHPGFLILRRAGAPGWSASVNGEPRPLAQANGRHQAVAVPAGTSEVVLRYRAPRAALGLTISLLSLTAAAVIGLWGRPRRASAF